MKKLTSLLMLALFLFTGLSMKAQVLVSQGVYYKPGARIDMSTVTAGQKVFIYSTFNDGTNNYSRFIVNSNNSATVAAADVTPANFVTNGVSNIWEVQSVADETSNGVTAKKITLVRNMGVTANKYLGIGGASSNGSVGDAQTFYVTSWSDDVYKSGTTKVSGTKFYVDATGESGESWSDTQTDNVYMVTAGTSKCFRTSGGSYNTSSTEAYPIIFYTVESATTPEGARDLKISDAPSGGQWAANTTWYKIKIDGTSNRYWSVDKNYTDVNGNLKLSNTTEPTNLAGLWCVVGDVVNGYKFYNAAKGTNYVLSTTGSDGGASTKMVATSSVGSLVTNFDICTTQYSAATTTSWAVKDKDSDYNYLNYREPYLAHWNHANAFHSSNGKGSMIDFIEVGAEDVASYVEAEKTSVLSRFEAWTHIPALWPTASDVYNALNTAVTAESATDATKLAAIQTAGEAFVAALNGVRFTAQNRGDGDLSSRFLSIGSSSCVGVIPDYSMDEVLTMKPNTDGSFKIYGENSGKYISSSASAVDLASAEDFYLQTSASDVTAVENVAGFHLTSDATNLLHLNNIQNEGTTENPMIVSGFGDAASRWLLSTDVSRHDLKATLDAQTWYNKYSTNIINLEAPSVAAYKLKRQEAEHMINLLSDPEHRFDNAYTQLDVNTAVAELKVAYEQMLNNFLREADATQGYRLIYRSPDYTAGDLYMTLDPTVEETNAINVMQVKTRNAATLQTIQFRNGAEDNQFYIIEGFNKLELAESTTVGTQVQTWNPTLVASGSGKLYTFERVSLDGVDELIVRIITGRGKLGPDSKTPSDGAYVYNNKEDGNYWIVKPCVSPELVVALYNKVYEAKKYEGHVGTGVGKYSTARGFDNDGLVNLNNTSLEFINETGAYAGTDKTNTGVQSQIDFYNTKIFPFTLNMPTPGKLYRFKGKKSGKYMASSSTRNKMVLNEEAANGLETVFKLVEDGGNYKLLNCGNGYFITNTHEASALKANANTITFNASESSYIGYYTIKTNYSSPYIFDDKTDNEVDRNSSYAADNCDWQIEEVTWLPVPINTTVGYGTLYSPVPLKGVSSGNYDQDGRLEFYYGVKVNEAGVNKLKLTKLEGDIPAETGLIVKYKDGIQSTGCVYMEIADTDPEFTADNALTGTLETVAKPATGTVYTMQKPADSPLGFYNFTGTNVKGGKAYLHVVDSEAAPMGLVFDFGGETTGVESIEVNTDNQVIYDLSGRRVAKAGKGLYIINGKKVLVK